jgi:hypothetical protein
MNSSVEKSSQKRIRPRLKLHKDTSTNLYAEALTPAELIELERFRGLSPQEELVALRILIYRTLLLSNEAQSLEMMLKCLDGLGLACTRLTNMFRYLQKTGNDTEPMSQALIQAIDEVLEETEALRLKRNDGE